MAIDKQAYYQKIQKSLQILILVFYKIFKSFELFSIFLIQ